MTTDPPPPRRKWHFARWLIVLIIAMFGWSGWRAYAFRSALSQAKALGWAVQYTDPVETIRKNWKAAFRKETWLDGVTELTIPTSEAFEQNLAIVHRLNPRKLEIPDAATLRDLFAFNTLTRLQGLSLTFCTALTNVDGLKNLSALQEVKLHGCEGLTNVDAFKSLSALEGVVLSNCKGLTNLDAIQSLSTLKWVSLIGCSGLTNVDALKNLSALKAITLNGCTGLTKEAVAALKAALPNAQVADP